LIFYIDDVQFSSEGRRSEMRKSDLFIFAVLAAALVGAVSKVIENHQPYDDYNGPPTSALVLPEPEPPMVE
jgi:hypothetical protein